MFPIDYQVNIRRGDGPVRRYTLLENQDDKFLVVVNPTAVREMQVYMGRGAQLDDNLISLLADEAMVLDRKKGNVLPTEKALEVMARSEHAAIRRAAMFRQPLPAFDPAATGEDLAFAFGLEVAKRRLTEAN